MATTTILNVPNLTNFLYTTSGFRVVLKKHKQFRWSVIEYSEVTKIVFVFTCTVNNAHKCTVVRVERL